VSQVVVGTPNVLPEHRAVAEELLCADWGEDNMRTQARDAYSSFLHVAQHDIHHRDHQGVVEGVVLSEASKST
jgi:hypothetical protein